jgi:arylsulfatase K
VSKEKPNVLFIFTDSWDGRMLGCMGHPALRNATPNVDRLAQRGTMFRNTYSTHPICCPQRANLWSGQYSFHCESWNNHKGLEPGTRTFKDRLEGEAGYVFGSELGGFGKHDYLSGRHTHLARMTAWTGPADIELPVYPPEEPEVIEEDRVVVDEGDWDKAEQACRFLEAQVGAEDPFFCYVGLNLPHPAFRTSRHWLDRIDVDAVDIPRHDETDHPVIRYQRTVKNWGHGFDEETVRRTRAIYFAMIAEVDAIVGKIVDRLGELGLADNTVIVFGSDHGELALEHQDWYKMSMYEASVRVPLVVAGPGIRENAVVDDLVSVIDLHPTFTDLAGLEPSPGIDARSLTPSLTTPRAERDAHRESAFAMFTGSTMNTTAYMLRHDRWKYIAYVGYPPQLFDLEADPEELDNRAVEEPEIVGKLDDKLQEIGDYEEVHRRVIEYDKASFREWRRRAKAGEFSTEEYGNKGTPLTTYEEIMKNSYHGFGPEHEQKLESWLAGTDSENPSETRI